MVFMDRYSSSISSASSNINKLIGNKAVLEIEKNLNKNLYGRWMSQMYFFYL